MAVVSTVGGIACVFWVTRRGRICPNYAPPVTIFKPLKGLDEGLEENLRSFFRLDYPCFQLLFCVADDDDPAIDVVRKLHGRVSRPGRAARRRLPGLRAQSQGREPGGDGPASQARRDPDQRFERPGAAVLPARDGLLPGRAGRRAGDEPLRRRGRSAPGAVMENLQLNGFIAAGVAAASVLRATCVVGKSMLMPVRVLEAIGGFAAVRNVLAEDQVIGVRVRKAGYSIRLSHHVDRKRELAPELQMVFEPSLALVQDPPPARLAGLYCRAGGQPGDGRAGLGVLGRFGHRLGRAAAAGRPGDGARRDSDPLAARVVSRGCKHLLFSPVKDILLLPVWFDAILNRRVQWRGQSVPGRPDDAAAPGPRSAPGAPARVAGAQDPRPERRTARTAPEELSRTSLAKPQFLETGS